MKFLLVTTHPGIGASEFLWMQTAHQLTQSGHQVHVAMPRPIHLDRSSRIPVLDTHHIPHTYLSHSPLGFRIPVISPLRFWASNLGKAIHHYQPDFILLSNGSLIDSQPLANTLTDAGISYATIDNGVFAANWPDDTQIPRLRSLYTGAIANFFVSEASRKLAETQLATTFNNPILAYNPYLVDYDQDCPWPDNSNGIHVACVGRLHPRHKGQDILLQAFALPHWRDYPTEIHLHFYGDGPNAASIKELAKQLDLKNVHFHGHMHDVAAIWKSCHLLAMPSRQENLPLTLVESMFCGRPCVATPVDGIPEIVDDGKTGFLSPSTNVQDYAKTLTRAFDQLSDWPAIGQAARQKAQSLFPRDPAQLFADKLIELATKPQGNT